MESTVSEEDNSHSTHDQDQDHFIPTAFVIGRDRKKAWYYHRGADGRSYFLAFVNAKGSCSMRTFDAETGRFLGKKYPQGGGDYQDKFASLIQSAKEVSVASQPNLERDCKDKLPQSLLQELKSQMN
jgi:hypothetical protein